MMPAPLQTGLRRLMEFNARASRPEYWSMFAAALVLTFAYQASYIAVFGLPTEFAVSSSDEVSRAGAEGAVQTAFLLNGAVFVYCAILLPVTARRFKDCGWRGGWFRIAWAINLVNLAVIAFGVIASATGDTRAYANWFVLGFLSMAQPYFSVLCCIWIGFLRPEAQANAYGPATPEVAI